MNLLLCCLLYFILLHYFAIMVFWLFWYMDRMMPAWTPSRGQIYFIYLGGKYTKKQLTHSAKHFRNASQSHLTGRKGHHWKHCNVCWPRCQIWLIYQGRLLQSPPQPGSCLPRTEMGPHQMLLPCWEGIPSFDDIGLPQQRHWVADPLKFWPGNRQQQGHLVSPGLVKDKKR